MYNVTVELQERAYPIWIDRGARQRLPATVAALSGVARVAVIADSRVADLHLQRIVDELPGPPAVVATFEPGEQAKRLAEVERLYGELARAQIGRRDLVLTLGGGVAGDLGGFVAATWLRGVRFIQIPTTLLAAIDASIGGKTGVNHAAGKNLIGAFHQPSAVTVDVELLDSLPEREYVAGLAESVKHAVIRDPQFFGWHEQQGDGITGRDSAVLAELIARNCEIKAEVVARDEREADLRMILNHGHTIGHAIEHLLHYELRHGECIALGMLVENEIACKRGLLTQADAERIAQLMGRFGLPQRLPGPLDAVDVARTCEMDKKARGGAVHYVLLAGIGRTERVADVSEQEIADALKAVQPD